MRPMEDIIWRYNAVVVGRNVSYWSWTGGSVTPCDIERDGEAATCGKMIAQTARVLDAHESTVRARRTQADEVIWAGRDVHWIEDRVGCIKMARRADRRPAAWRYAATLARRFRGRRMRSGEAIAVALQRLAEEEAIHQQLHDVMYDLLGLAPIHCPTCAEMWPAQYAVS